LETNRFSDQIEINKIVEHLNNQVSLGDKTISPIGNFFIINQNNKCLIKCSIILVYLSFLARQHIYNLFGVIAQHHPMYLKNYEDKLMNLFCYELQSQVNIIFIIVILFRNFIMYKFAD